REVWVHAYLVEGCDIAAGCMGIGPDNPPFRLADTPETSPFQSLTVDYSQTQMILDHGVWPARLLSRIPVLNRFASQRHTPGRQGYFHVRILPRSSMSDQVYWYQARIL